MVTATPHYVNARRRRNGCVLPDGGQLDGRACSVHSQPAAEMDGPPERTFSALSSPVLARGTDTDTDTGSTQAASVREGEDQKTRRTDPSWRRRKGERVRWARLFVHDAAVSGPVAPPVAVGGRAGVAIRGGGIARVHTHARVPAPPRPAPPRRRFFQRPTARRPGVNSLVFLVVSSRASASQPAAVAAASLGGSGTATVGRRQRDRIPRPEQGRRPLARSEILRAM